VLNTGAVQRPCGQSSALVTSPHRNSAMPDTSTNLNASGAPSSTESVVTDSLQIEADEAGTISFHECFDVADSNPQREADETDSAMGSDVLVATPSKLGLISSKADMIFFKCYRDSSTSSLKSSITKYIFENGRRYHALNHGSEC